MPRQPRIEYEGALYHIMSRGNAGQRVYFDEAAHELFIDTLDEACRKTGWNVHAYVLMPNHYHLLVETPAGNLVDGMRWLQGTFTSRINARYKRRGHLFQGRYKALLVDPDDGSGAYFRTVADHIHLNPARAGLLRVKGGGGKNDGKLPHGFLWEYRWSSYPLYRGWKKKRPRWLVTDRVLGEHGWNDDSRGRRSYSQYLERRAVEKGLRKGKEWGGLRRGWYLGGDVFRDSLLDRAEKALSGKKGSSYSGELIGQHDRHHATRLMAKALHVLGLKEGDLGEMKKSAADKQVIAWLLRKNTTVSLEWIARQLAMGHYSSVTAAVRMVSTRQTGELKRKRKKLEGLI